MMATKAMDADRPSALRIYAVVAMDGDVAKIRHVIEGLQDEVELIGGGRFGAVVSNAVPTVPADLDRRELARRLLAHQQVVERVMAVAPVLPVKFSTLAPDRKCVERSLEVGEEKFATAFEGLMGKAQFEVVVTWDIERVFGEIAAEPAIVELKAELAAAAGNVGEHQRAEFGRIVKQSLERRQSEVGAGLQGALSGVAIDSIVGPLMDDHMVLNLALLVAAEPADTLDRCLEDLDAAHDGRLSFRCVGPLPPHSFATVEISFLGLDEIAHAQSVLELDCVQHADEVRAAYRRIAKRIHPDVAPDRAGGVEMTMLYDAYKALLSFVDAGGPVAVAVRRQEAASAAASAATG